MVDAVVTPTPPVAPPTQVAAPSPTPSPALPPPADGLGASPPPEANADSLAKPVAASVAFDAAKLTLPEGLKTDDPTFKAFTEFMADDKLSAHDRGQKLLDLYTKQIKESSEASVNAWNDMQKDWIGKVKADPDIGGAKFEPTKQTISKAIDGLGTQLAAEVRQALDVTGAGNNPAIWKAFAKWASMLTEGGHVAGSPAASAPADAKAFFPNSNMTGT